MEGIEEYQGNRIRSEWQSMHFRSKIGRTDLR